MRLFGAEFTEVISEPRLVVRCVITYISGLGRSGHVKLFSVKRASPPRLVCVLNWNGHLRSKKEERRVVLVVVAGGVCVVYILYFPCTLTLSFIYTPSHSDTHSSLLLLINTPRSRRRHARHLRSLLPPTPPFQLSLLLCQRLPSRRQPQRTPQNARTTAPPPKVRVETPGDLPHQAICPARASGEPSHDQMGSCGRTYHRRTT